MMRFPLNKSLLNRNTLFRSISNSKRSADFYAAHSIQEAGLGKYIAILSPLLIGGGIVTYAKSDKEFRNALVSSVPAIEPVLKVLLQEEGNAVSQATKSINNATQKVIDAKDTVVGFFGGDKPAPVPAPASAKSQSAKPSGLTAPPMPQITAPGPLKAEAEPTKKTPAASAPPTKAAPATAAPPKAPAVAAAAVAAVAAPAKVAKAAEQKPSAPVQLPPAVQQALPQTFDDLEKDIDVAARIAVAEYTKAVRTLQEYAEDVKKVVDHAIEKTDNSVWSLLKNKTSARDTAVETAERAAQEALGRINQLEKHITAFNKTVSPELLEKAKRTILAVSNQLSHAKNDLYVAKDTAKLSEQYWKKVEEARNYFVDQVQSLFPGVDLSDRKWSLHKDDVDLFILHAYSHILAYQKELQKVHAEGEIRLRRAIDALKGDDQTEAVNRQIEYLLEKEKQNLALDNQKRLLRIQSESEASLRQQLKVQTEAHTDHLQDALSEKERELRRVFERELNEKLSIEQSSYKIQLATMLGKLKGMDAALKEIEEELQARADADRQVHQAQALWSATSALWSTMRNVDAKQPWQDQLRPLRTEVEAVKKAAEQDELVKVIVDSLPETAKTRGVFTETALRERFLKVEQLARRLALVPEKDATIVTYALSYLQSMLIIQPKELISKAELNNEPVDFTQLNTYEILNRTRYYVDRGNFTQALRYANLLKGASRKIAGDWINETRLLLETQQAVNVLLAHAATSGLAFL